MVALSETLTLILVPIVLIVLGIIVFVVFGKGL
ncbi:MAG: hypothetical protein V7605_934 [Acidimicrobiaceae bacterium]|jgi:hypothetical protein